jgi:geranylgeranyl pyrophosphate synthase
MQIYISTFTHLGRLATNRDHLHERHVVVSRAHAFFRSVRTYTRIYTHTYIHVQTASLICDACKSCAILGGHAPDSDVARAAEAYGFHLGLAYQIIDDVLDFTVASDVLGKPVRVPCLSLKLNKRVCGTLWGKKTCAFWLV